MPDANLEVLKSEELSEFVQHFSNYDAIDVPDWIQGLSRQQVLTVCEALLAQVNKALNCLYNEEPNTPRSMQQQVAGASALHIAALLAHDVLLQYKAALPQQLMDVASVLHEYLLDLSEVPDYQDATARLCSTWWLLGAPGKEHLIASTVPYVVMKAVEGGKAADVKAAFQLRHAMALYDWDDDSINDLKGMLLRCAISPAFLRRPDGRRLVGFLFTLHPQMVRELTSVIRNQIPSGRKSLLDYYGEVVFRGWHEASGACLLELESCTIQGLAEAALKASTPAMAGHLRKVLQGMHSQKRVAGVDAALLRLYEPLLFRALAAANPAVRRNALLLLFDAFPLLDPDLSDADTNELMTRQFQALMAGLEDEVPAVRATAIAGTCTVLNLFWEMVPSATAALFMNKLTGELAFDMAHPCVRISVLMGLKVLLDNQHAQAVLKKALPQLAPLMHDSSPKVREAMAELLLTISACRDLHFYDVVPLETLLQVLTNDTPAVTHIVHHVLVPSYFPANSPEEGAVRVAALLRASPDVGRTFCQLLVSAYTGSTIFPETGMARGRIAAPVQLPVEQILALAVALKEHLLLTAGTWAAAGPAPAKKQRGGRREPAAAKATGKRKKQNKAEEQEQQEQGQQQEQEQQEEDVPAAGALTESREAWCALLAGLAELCLGLGAAVEEQQVEVEELQEGFGAEDLRALLQACPDTAARQQVWRIGEGLPFLEATAALRDACLRDLASGSFWAAADGPSGAGSSSGQQYQPEEFPQLLACIAAAPSGAKLLAVLCQALGAEWRCTTFTEPEAEGLEGADEDATCCTVCNKREPEHNMLLCDGCDAPYHTDCLQPALPGIPTGCWLCDGCEQQVTQAGMSTAQATRCVLGMLEQCRGRDMLSAGGTLQRLLPALASSGRGLATAAAQQLQRAGSSTSAAAATAASDCFDTLLAQGKVLMHCALQRQHQQLLAAAGSKGDISEEEVVAAAEAVEQAKLQLQQGFQQLLEASSTLAAAASAVVAAAIASEAAGNSEDGTEGNACAAVLPGLAAVVGLVADAMQLKLLCLSHANPAAQALAEVVSEALVAAEVLMPVAAGSAVEEVLAGLVLACAALVRQLALAAVELPPAAAAKAAGGAAGRLAALMCTSSAAWLLPRLKTLLTPLVAALAMHDQAQQQGFLLPLATSAGEALAAFLRSLPSSRGFDRARRAAAQQQAAAAGADAAGEEAGQDENRDPKAAASKAAGAAVAQPDVAWAAEAAEGWLEEVPAFVGLVMGSVRSRKVGEALQLQLARLADTCWQQPGAQEACLGAVQLTRHLAALPAGPVGRAGGAAGSAGMPPAAAQLLQGLKGSMAAGPSAVAAFAMAVM